MHEPATRSLQSLSPHGFHRVVYRDWGDCGARDVVVCVHGLTRNGRDFDDLARALAPSFRVLCPDMPGRGDSEWLADPLAYVAPTYLSTLAALIARSGAERVLWVGTSMGGILGMMLAALPQSPIACLVVNDVGPVMEREGLGRIAANVALDPRFDSMAEMEAHVRRVAAPFGDLTDAQWRRITETSARALGDGRYAFRHDPAIAVPLRAAVGEPPLDLWATWDAIRCPTLVIRGERSDVLSRDTALAMTRRGPRASLVEFPSGHAPMLMADSQIDAVEAFLDTHRAGEPA